ncbi:hypothetical protein JG687_00000483 [Phytophthora cactorum]|uniref:Uncharacterized protein n=1 Tax=Phytophthora cactorum TaxID=29920 RepID=A0A8T1UZV7_9STRA|nr:hypothetical protein JG687_00000483 [Phytophthora cactorum]
MRYALYLILLLLAGYHSIVHAVDATVSASWSNATVSAAQILELVLTTGDDPLLPADALLEIQLNSLFTVASDAGVDEAVLRETLSGTWSVTVDTSAKKLTVQRRYKCSLASTNPTPEEDACPMGGYCNPPTTFFLCPAGTFGNVTAGEFYDQDMILRSDEDGDVDCQPIVYDRCSSNQVRSDSGSCVSASGKACDATCNNGTGTYVASLGVCQCDEQPDLDTVCNKKCRDEATQIQVNSSTGELQLYNPVTGEVLPISDEDNTSGLVSKDSMLNTNPSFDYGAFRSLATKVNANTSTVSAFAFSFTEPGTYVFGNSLNSAAQTIVVVMKTGTSCPTEAPIVPLNEKNLVTVSAKRRTDDIILAPDWGLIMGLLGGLFGVVIAVIGGLYYFRAKSWTNTAVKSISGYRAKNKQVNLAAMHSKGTVAVTTDAAQDGGGSSALLTVEPTTGKQLQLGRQEPMKGTSMEYHADLGRWDEEDLDLRELVDRLQFHHEAVTKNFEDQKGDVKQLMQHLHAEAIELKRLFVNALVASDLMSTSPDASKEDPGGSETTEASETLPVSKISGRLRSKSVAGREKFLLENLERDLQDREQFEQKKTAMLGSVSADLREVEGWSAQLAELTGAIVQEMSSPVDDRTPESTSTNEESCLEHTRMVLDDLKTLLGSDPMTQTSSSLVHLAEQEKGRREVGNFVLEASQRYFTPRSAAQDSTSSNNVVHRLLELHDDVEKTQNKEDEALFGPLSSLQKFGAALPQVLATIDDLETSFRCELDAVREEQNPVKERAVQAQMQSRLSKLLKEVAAGAKKVNERLEKEAPRTIKLRHGAQHAEDALSRAVTSAKEQWDIANQEQRDRIGVATSAQDPEEAVVQTPSSVEELAASKLRDDTLFQIKDLLVGLTTLLRTNGVPLMAAPQQLAITAQPQSPPAWVDSRVVADAKRNNESATQQSAAEYASELTVSYPQLSAVDKERLLDDFASDLRTIQSSVSVEATRTQAELATRQAATEALVEAKRAYVQRREQEDADVLRAQHDEEEQSLESQFRDEELAIEQEYLKELSSLEMEFGSDGGDEAVRDFAGSPDTMFDDFANGMEGDESSFPGLTEAEDIADILDSKLGIPVDDNADIIAQLNDVYSQAWSDRVRILAMEEALKKEQLNERLRRKRNALKGSTDAVEEGNLDTSQPEKELNELMLESSELKEEILEEIVKKQDDMDVLQQEAVNRAVERLRQQVADCEIRSDVNEENDLQRSQDALTELVIAARHAAQADKVAADKVIAHTEDELQMLQNEYDRDFMALREEIENERLRLNAKMQSALSAKRRRGTTKDEKGDDEVFAEQTDGDLVEELETQLEEFTNTAIEELRDKHFQLQQKVEAEKTQATVAVAVAEAQLAYLDELPSSGQVNQATTKTTSLVETPRSRVEVTEELLEALANRIPVQIELQFQEELDKLHVDYMLACAERRRELEADAAMRRAKLAEKMNRRRLEKESNSSQEERKHQPASSLAEALDAQEQVELAKIYEELKAAIAALDDYERQGGETLAKSLASTLHSCGKEVEGQIRQCRQQHEVAASLLKPADDKGAKELANTVVNVLDALESEASQRAKAAAQAREAIEHEIERLQDESSSSLAALTVALDAEKRRQEQRLKQRMKQRREQQQTQLPVGSSPEKIAEMNAVLAEQEMVERQKLEDQLETQAQLAFDEERGKQREHEDRLAQQLREATVAEIAASTTKEAVAQARNEYLNSGNDNALTALMRLWRTRQPSKSSVKEATKLVRKRSVASRLAALAAPSLTIESSSVKQNVVADTMAAEMEQQIKALSASHLRAWQQRQQELQEEEARRKAELESRLRRKRDAKLHAGSQQTDKGDEEDEQLHQQLVTDAIKRKFAMEAEIDMDLELIATAVQSAGGQTTSDIEALLAACHSTIEAETAALGDTLRVQRQAQEEALRQRLQQRRRDKVRELESTGKSSDPSALAGLEDALKEVEATELRSIAGKETQQLSALHERLRSQVGAAFAEADRKAKRRCDDVNARLASSEEELNGIYREHEEGRRALRESLGVEQRRQQDKLLERMARRRAERLADLKREHPNDLSEAITQKAMLELNNEHEGERLRLEDGISEQTTKALQELDDKTREKETFLQAETRRLRAEAEAAQAAREALAVAHCAEAERVTREFYACLGGGVDVEKKQHDEAQRKLRETLEMERRKQEQLFQERRCQRRAARRAGTEPMPKQGTEEAEEEGLKRELETQLCAEQAQAWTALREREQQDVEAVLAPLEAAVGRRLDDAELAERRAREELERLAEEHDRRLAELRESLEAEKKRQQLALREKLRRKRDQRRADGVSMPDEEARGEERQAMEALETSFETNLASAESEALENRREKGTELLAQVCALSASRAAEEAALTLLDAARLEAERVREEYEAALASRVQVSAVADAISREEMAKRLADRRQKRRQDREQQKPREITVLELTPNEPEDGGSVDREIAVVQAAHARGVKSRRDQLDAETAARKAALAARLEHKRRAARQSGESGKSEAEIEKALLLEEQEELAAIEQERVVEEREIEAEASREKERLAKTLREADERGAADIEQQLSACKQAHDTESAKLEEALRAERARQELALKQRLNAKRQRIQAGGGGATDKDSNDTEATNEHEVQAAQAELEEQERVARQQLTERQQQELADVARKLEQETEAQRLAAFDLQAAAERELKRLEEEHARERRALQEALLADQRKRETQLREKLAKKKAARQAKGSSDRQDEEDAEEGVAMAALQEEIMQEQAEALGKERERQETAMRLAAAELQEAATASAKAAAASRQAQEEAARVAAEFDRHRGEAQQLQTAEAAHSKSKLADRLAEKKNKRHLKQQQKQENDDGNAAAKSLEDEAERLRLEAQIEAQLVACREAHDAEAAKLRESLQAERERQERALQERIARRKEKRNLADAQASTKADVKAAEEAELKQQQEEEAALAAALAAQEQEAWDTIERKQGEDLRVLQEQKQQQERERAVRQQQQAQQEMNRLQEEHERELRALTASLAQEQARQEEKLQQRIAQRRARKQRQEEETAGTSAKAQQSNVDAEEEARITAESQRAKALAQAQAQAEAEAEEKERQEIAARLALKLEEERARQRREKEELEARLNREAEEQAAKRAEALALQLQQQAIETADKMAHEFNTNLRELRETHSADGAAQKARLESRIAAKKTRKLRELEEKRELERQRLHARQQQEAEEAAKAEKEREEALAEAARQAAIPVAETIVNDEPAAVAVLCPAEEKAEANRQQQQDVAAVQQLFTYGLVPGKLSLLGAVELVVGARHERELAVQLVELATKTLDNVRQALQAVTQQKAARKAQALQEISSRQASSAETDTVLSQIDAEFAEKLREAECLATEESEKTKREAEKRLKERQMREVAFLLAHFDAQHTEALTNVPAIATQVQPLQQQPQQPTMTAAQREAEDLVAELRARLELEADERRRELEEEKRLELERLAKEEQDQLAQVEAGVAALLAEERAAMARLQVSRLQKLPPGAVKQREAAERERTAQLQRLTLMLEGRGRQQKDRVRARIVQQKALIEDEFRRKGQIIIAVMNQRLVQEKAGLRQRQELLKPYPENAQASDQAPQQQDKDTSQSMLTDELAKRLEDVLEERLAKIEALVADFKHNVHDPPPQENTATKETNLEEDSSSSVAYRLAVAEAVAAGCRYEKLHIADKESLLASSAFGVLDANAVNASKLAQVSANKLDDRMRVRRDFAELLLQAVAAKDEPAAVLAVVELFGRENNGRADYASFSPQKKSKGTLYLSLAALQDLSTGQLAVVMLHALAQARANTSDLTEPQFVSHLYNLLVRCYQGLFLHVQQQQRATSVATASTVTEISRKSVSDGGEAGKTVDTSTKVQWQARLLEMEGFLTRMGSQKAAIQRSQSSQLRLLPKQREGDNAGEASASMSSGLWQQEQGQVLQEKLDTAEKLYLQVLRQHEQQTQTVEYWQDLLAEQREAEYEEDAFDEEGEEDSKKTHTEDPNAAERQQQREARAQEAQSELDGASQVLEATRKERDELFAQYQAASDGGAMAKERISSEELAQRKEEYYELLATSDSTLQDVLNQRGGLVLARVGRYQPWPARFSEPGEFAKMARYRAKKGQACVYFFGSRNYGWVSKSSIQPFPEDLTTLTASNKYNQQHIQDALDEAKLVMDVTDETGKRFFDRIMERKEEAVDLPCERCNRVDDHYSLLILCDGKNCKREYHMNCLTPPLVSVPPGEWFCPDCEKEREKEREKELQKRAKAEAIDSQDSSVTAVNGLDGTLPLAKTPSTKKTKKHKHNSRDGIVKRRLSSVSPDRPGGPVKKPRGHRSSSREVSPPPRKDPAMPKKLDGRKKKPSQLSISSSRAQLLSDPDNGTADDELRSEEKCLICGFGGELIVCEFTGCTKVYHQFCLGAYPFPKDEDATWYCPRHTCALTGEKESCEDGEKSTNKLKHASPRKPNVKNLLWKCNQCPLAISDGALPQPVDGQLDESRTQLDLFKVLARIRRLEYEDSAAFSRDIDEVVANAVDLIANRSYPLMEAAKTLKIIRNEQFAIHQQKLDFLDSKIRRVHADRESGRDNEDDLAAKRLMLANWKIELLLSKEPLKGESYLAPRTMILSPMEMLLPRQIECAAHCDYNAWRKTNISA